MLIRRIEVSNFKRLIGPLVFDGLIDGINIISGNNEEGKSTLLQAIRAAVFQRHNSKTQQVSDFRPYNRSVRPEVTLDLELNSKSYSIKKGFLQKANAVFRSPDGIFEGSEAEEKIRELFGLPSATDKAKKSESDTGIWGLLWLEQGSAEGGLRTTDGGKETMMRALESDVAEVTGGQRGRLLQKRIEKQVLNYYTEGKKNEKGDLQKAADLVSAKEAELAGYKQRFGDFERKLLRLQDTQEKLAEFEKARAIEKAKAELQKIQQDMALLERLKFELQAANQFEKTSDLELGNIEKQIEDRNKIVQKKEAAGERLKTLTSDLELKQAKELEDKEKLSKAQVKHEESEKAYAVIAAQCKEAEQRESYTKLKQQHTELTDKKAQFSQLQQRIDDLTKQRDEMSITDKTIENLRSLKNELLVAETRANAAATRLVLKPKSTKKAVIDGKIYISETDLSLNKETKIQLDDWGELRIYPGGEKTAELTQLMEQAKEKLEKALKDLALASIEEAEELCNARKELEFSISSCKREIETNGGEKALAELTKRLSSVSEKLSSVDEACTTGQEGNAEGSGSSSLEQLREELEEANLSLSRNKEIVEAGKEKLQEIRLSLVKLETEQNACQILLKDLTQQHASLSSDSTPLQELKREAELKLLEARKNSQDKRNELGKLKESELKEAKEDTERKQRQLEYVHKQLNEERIRLEAEISTEGQSGLGERLEKCSGELELLEQKLKQIRTRAQALLLLHETLIESEAESREKIMQPVLEILRPTLSAVFPGSSLAFDETNMEISHLLRAGQEEPFKDLSFGTREQISVLTRIAIAKMLKQQGQSSLMLLDDALVHSDDGRFALMKKLIIEASQEMQVIILTCRMRDYDDIPDSKVFEFNQPAAVQK